MAWRSLCGLLQVQPYFPSSPFSSILWHSHSILCQEFLSSPSSEEADSAVAVMPCFKMELVSLLCFLSLKARTSGQVLA